MDDQQAKEQHNEYLSARNKKVGDDNNRVSASNMSKGKVPVGFIFAI